MSRTCLVATVLLVATTLTVVLLSLDGRTSRDVPAPPDHPVGRGVSSPAHVAATRRGTTRTVCAHPFFPAGVGASWSYEVRSGGAAMEATLRVVAREPDAPERFAVEASRTLVVEGRRELHSSDRALLACDDDLADEAWSLVAAPLGPGARPHGLPAALSAGRVHTSTANHERPSFQRPGELDRIEIQRSSEVRSEETITVPSGTFRAVRVRHVDRAPPLRVPGRLAPIEATVVMEDWLAEGVGLVRRLVYAGPEEIGAEAVLLEHVPAP